MELVETLSWIVLAAAALALFVKLVSWKGYANLPPGSMGWPLVGETLEYLATRPVGVPQPFIIKRVARYGDVFKTHLFGRPTIITTDPDLNRFILANEGRLFQSNYPPAVANILGKYSMVQASGELHKKMRALTLSFMQLHKLKDYFLQDIQKCVRNRISTWEGRVVYVHKEAESLSLDFIVKQVLSMDPAEKRTQQLKTDYLSLVYGMMIPLKIPGTPYSRAMKGRQNIAHLIESMIAERQANRRCKDFLQTILDEDNGKNLSPEQITDLLIFMLFAAHDTTATAMTMAIKYLLDHPAALEELRAEHLEIRKNKARDENLDWDDYLRMTFTQYVINETLRLTNVMTSPHRVALENIQLKGYFIPKGWKVLPNWTSIHLNKNIYPDPLKFDPWRWKNTGMRYFTAFSGGTRLCSGNDLARLEIALFLHFAVTEYRWRAAEPDEAICYGTVKTRKGIPIIVTKP